MVILMYKTLCPILLFGLFTVAQWLTYLAATLDVMGSSVTFLRLIFESMQFPVQRD